MKNNLHVFLGATVADAAARPLHWVYNQKKLSIYIKGKKDFSFLKEKRIFWCRCDVSIRKNVDDIMKRIWNKPRFDIIIDNTNNHENLKRHCIGKYYLENKDEVICYSS